jgi:hypothetical protein
MYLYPLNFLYLEVVNRWIIKMLRGKFMKHKGKSYDGNHKAVHRAKTIMPVRGLLKSQAPQVGNHVTNARNQLR